MVRNITWGSWQIFTRALESLKIGTLIGFFCPKLQIYELKIYRGVMYHDNDDWGIWWILIQTLENLKNLHFTGLPLIKVHNVWAKKVQRSYVWWNSILMGNLKEKWLLLSKILWGIWEIFTRALESLKIWTLMGFFYLK